MSPELEQLIENARRHTMTPEERDDQVRSFAYGNSHIENPSITKAHIEKAFTAIRQSTIVEK